MLKSFFSKSINIPTLRLSGVIGQAGFMRSGLNIIGQVHMKMKGFLDKKYLKIEKMDNL